MLTNMVGVSAPGAAQTALRIFLRVQPVSPGATVYIIAENDLNAAAAAEEMSINWSGQMIIPPNWRLGAQATFSAGAVANTIRVDFYGILIPVGNIQRL